MIGSLLHDIGKVIYRTGSHDNHSSSGYSYLKEEIGIDDVDILESVLYHHASMLRSANISKNHWHILHILQIILHQRLTDVITVQEIMDLKCPHL